MAQLSYSFCMSLLHSLWQAAVLLLLYYLIEKSLQHRFTPLQKRNLLFVSLGVQTVLLVSTFCIYYFDVENDFTNSIITQTISGILSADSIRIISPWLFAGYVLIISYKMIKTIYDWFRFTSGFTKGIQKPDIDLKLFTALKSEQFGISKKVQLWYSNTINTPLTFGFFKPVIVLPLALINQLSITQAEALILHELTHIKANDYLLNWFLLLGENLFFFNPFILSLCKKIRLEREKYCDINVMAFNYAPLTYAETLLQAQQVKQYQAQYQLAAVGKKQELLQRIQFFTNTKNQLRIQQNHFAVPVLSGLLMLVLVSMLFFQYSIIKPKMPDTAVIFSPVNENAAADNLVQTVLENLTEEKLKAIEAAVEKQQPEIEKQIKTLAPLINEISTNATAMSAEINNNYIVPAALEENDASKQIVVREQQSGSKNAMVKVYTISFKNGQWVLRPEWKLAAKEISIADSLHNIDSTSPLPESQTAY
jgi:beta-lactamase regulating signal transducer with metallopeptidase domain